ncbi:Rpn family recombination-promoting nuclease/putative transposase [Shouchella lonarensis]|uniref:Uncharacterized protein n=1 Tax=Shouchella lonarensis TaxID=1464122 RepID=A0A1G6J7V6_9BACI|nr:Rpn family recombination-promoting nuclease/putative transposase [Shouchella lonarensis]SDC14435.1 conserved hypothetical protein (putative transposase or invertase) [Shouchella lonarensis]
MSNQQIPHDKLFKQLFDHFFTDFMQAFFPEEAREIDFSACKPIATELHSDGNIGSSLRPDYVVKTKMKHHDIVILIHLEAQASYELDFQYRMLRYYLRLFDQYRCTILPIAVFSYDQPNQLPPTDIKLGTPSETYLTFRYKHIFLRSLPWRKFLRHENPAIVTLLPKLGYNKEEKMDVALTFLRLMIKGKATAEQQALQMKFFASYMSLTKEEENTMREEVQKLVPKEKMDIDNIMTFFERDAWEKGIEEGIEKGIEKERTETAKRMLLEGAEGAFIAKVTQLPLEKVQELKEELVAE